MSTHDNRSAAGDSDFRVQTNLLDNGQPPNNNKANTDGKLQTITLRSHQYKSNGPIDTDRNQTIYYSPALFH